MRSAGIQTFCRKHNINIGQFNGKEVWPKYVTERNIALKIQKKKHFCFIWETIDISFKKAKEEFKNNFKVVDSVICDKHVKSFLKHE